MSLARELAPLYRRRLRRLLASVLLGVLAVAAGVGLLGVAGGFLTGAALAGSLITFNLFAGTSLVRGLSIARIGFRYAERIVGHGVTLSLLADLRGWVFARLLRLPLRTLSQFRSGDLVSRLTADIDALDTLFLFVLAPLAVAVVAGALLVALLAYWIVPAAIVLALGLLVVIVGVPLLIVRAARGPGQRSQSEQAQLRAAVMETVQGHADLIALGQQAHAQQQFEQSCQRLFEARRAQARAAGAGQFVTQAVAGLCVLATLAWGMQALSLKQVSGPILVGLVFAVLAIFEVAGPLMRGASRMGNVLMASDRIRRVVDEAATDPRARLTASLPEQGALVLEQVGFSYPGASYWPLNGVNLRVAQGERVAIVGVSGAGKSTLLNLLMQVELPTRGRILYGGVDLAQCAPQVVHRHFALLAQHSPVFSGTVRMNLHIGQAQADDDALWAALAAARLDTFVRELPGGLNAWIGEGGGTLSIGQARRLCLARALLSPAQVLVLDEPTSGVDAQTEQAFFQDLAHATRGRTVVMATHANLPPGTVDRVVRLSDGVLS